MEKYELDHHLLKETFTRNGKVFEDQDVFFSAFHVGGQTGLNELLEKVGSGEYLEGALERTFEMVNDRELLELYKGYYAGDVLGLFDDVEDSSIEEALAHHFNLSWEYDFTSEIARHLAEKVEYIHDIVIKSEIIQSDWSRFIVMSKLSESEIIEVIDDLLLYNNMYDYEDVDDDGDIVYVPYRITNW